MKPENTSTIRFFFDFRLLLNLALITSLIVLPVLSGCKRETGDTAGGATLKDKGKSEETSGLIDSSRIVATFTPESRTSFQYNPPTIVGDHIYIGTSTKIGLDGDPAATLAALPANFFYKLDLNLKVVWQYPMNATMTGGGASLDSQGNIYFVTLEVSIDTTGKTGGKGYLTNISLFSLTGDGKFRWKKLISDGDEVWVHGMINCAIGADDTVYVGDSKFFAFDPAGNIKWQYPADRKIIRSLRSAPIIDRDGNIYFISPEPTESEWGSDIIRAYKFFPSGEIVWSTVLDNNLLEPEGGTDNGGGHKEDWMLSTPAFSTGCRSLYAAVGNTINRVDTATGEIIWSLKPEGASGSFKASPAVDAEDNVYIGSKSNNDSRLYAIKADGSGIIWARLMGADMYPSPLLGDDGKLYTGSEGTPYGHFHAINMKTGESVWGTGYEKSSMPDISFSSPALDNGYIYIGAFEVGPAGPKAAKALFKIKADAKGYLPGAGSPRYHGNNANNGRGGF